MKQMLHAARKQASQELVLFRNRKHAKTYAGENGFCGPIKVYSSVEERTREEALAKLSIEERQMLGIVASGPLEIEAVYSPKKPFKPTKSPFPYNPKLANPTR